MKAIIVAARATPKMMVTTRPEVVSESSLTMHVPTVCVAEAEKQSNPGAQEPVDVVVLVQVVLPDVVPHTVVDIMEVMEQVREVPGISLA